MTRRPGKLLAVRATGFLGATEERPAAWPTGRPPRSLAYGPAASQPGLRAGCVPPGLRAGGSDNLAYEPASQDSARAVIGSRVCSLPQPQVYRTL